jgi:acetyl esterase
MSTLDPEIQAALALDLQRFGPAPAHLPGDPVAARAEQERRRAPWNVGGPQMAIQRDIAITLPDRSLTVRLYVPKLPAEGLVLYLHGGGWVIGSLDTHDRLTRSLAAASGLAFLGIGYRKAPEHPYPAALEDTLDVLDWLAANPDILGFPVRMDRLAVAGDSAGATIAAAAAMALGAGGKPVPIAFASIYGALDSDLDTVSYLMRGDGRYGLSRASMAIYWSLYCADPTRRRDALVAPARAPANYLAYLKRPFLLAAGLDPLRDDSRRMRDLMLAAGIDTAYVEFPRANHGFAILSEASSAARAAIAATAAHLRMAFDAQ